MSAQGTTHPMENSARPALRRWTAFCKCHSHTSLTRLSHQLPQIFPSFFVTVHIPKSRARPTTMIEAADSGVKARMLSVWCGLSLDRFKDKL